MKHGDLPQIDGYRWERVHADPYDDPHSPDDPSEMTLWHCVATVVIAVFAAAVVAVFGAWDWMRRRQE